MVNTRRIVVACAVVFACTLMTGFVPQAGRGHREQVIRFFNEVWTNGNLAVIDEMVAPDFTRHAPSAHGTVSGIPAFKQLVKTVRSSFTDYTITLEEMEGLGNKAMITWRVRGNYVGPNQEVPGGRAVDFTGKSVWYFDGNRKIASEIVSWDEKEYYRQIQLAVPYAELRNRAVALSLLYEVYGQGNLDALYELVSPQHILHDPDNNKLVGTEALKNRVMAFRTAFPDLVFSVHNIVADGNMVTMRWTMVGTHKGTWRNMEPTTTKVMIKGFTFCRIVDGMIAESWSTWDREAVMIQIGN